MTHSGEVIREFPLLVAHGDICTVQDQEGAELRAPLLSGFVKRREVPAVRGIHETVVLDQHGRNINVLWRRDEPSRLAYHQH